MIAPGVVVFPPEQLNLWTVEHTDSYKIWKGSNSTNNSTNNSMEDYRQLLININKDYNIDEICYGIEAVFSAWENLSDFSKLVPVFDVNSNIETIYRKEDKIDKVFFKLGLQFVLNYLISKYFYSRVTLVKYHHHNS